MAISKRLRYEILRRDNHTCRYCGASAPDVKLTVDHVLPVALGGQDVPENLVAACEPCNTGKTSSSPDAPVVADVERDAHRWAVAMRFAHESAREQREDEAQDCQDWLISCWRVPADSWGPTYDPPLPRNWADSVARFLALGFDFGDFAVAIDLADRHGVDSRFSYMCGVLWRMHRARADVARSFITVHEARV